MNWTVLHPVANIWQHQSPPLWASCKPQLKGKKKGRKKRQGKHHIWQATFTEEGNSRTPDSQRKQVSKVALRWYKAM